jgi:hypothetical protein
VERTCILKVLSMETSKNSIEQRLRAEKLMHAAPAGFTERVMSRLPKVRHDSPTVPVQVHGYGFLLRFAMAFSAIVIAAVFAFEFSRPKPAQLAESSAQSESIAPAAQPEVSIVKSDILIPVITPEQVQALTMKLDDPLEKELNNVISDTRQAIQFVALNFLPEK